MSMSLDQSDGHPAEFHGINDAAIGCNAAIGVFAETRSEQYRVVGDFLSYEPYGLMFRIDDPAFAGVVERGFRRLAASREIVWIYDKWFLKRLPSGLRLGLPMSPQLEETFRILGLPTE